MSLLSEYTVQAGKGLPKLVTEPTVDGGRDRVEGHDSLITKSNSYAQELAPIPLNMSPEISLSGPVRRGRPSGQDVEPFFHTVFCNELIFQPRILHHCERHIVVLGVEIREMEWKDNFGYIAHLPQSGSSIHNQRRGPFLVSDLFTTCATRKKPTEHHFIDEFKTKLPLDLANKRRDGTTRFLSLFFTVYDVKSDYRRELNPATELQASPFSFEGFAESTLGKTKLSCLEQVSCGFLPLLTNEGCLVDNGIHDVQLTHRSGTTPKKLCEQWGCPTTSLLLVKQKKGLESSQLGAKYEGDNTFILHESVSVRDELKTITEGCNDELTSLSVSSLLQTATCTIRQMFKI